MNLLLIDRENRQKNRQKFQMASFFYYQTKIGLVVKRKVQKGGLVLKNLIYIF